VSSGGRKIHRLSLRGNRRLNHAIHMAAVTQIRHPHSDGRAYFDRKIAEGKTGKEALRALKRKLSDVIYARLQADAARGGPAQADGPGGQSGNGSVSSAAGSHPRHRLFGQATPGLAPSLRPSARPGEQRQRRRSRTRAEPLDNKEVFVLVGRGQVEGPACTGQTERSGVQLWRRLTLRELAVPASPRAR
jgi:Transposase IS116/IS110/IS902 family